MSPFSSLLFLCFSFSLSLLYRTFTLLVCLFVRSPSVRSFVHPSQQSPTCLLGWCCLCPQFCVVIRSRVLYLLSSLCHTSVLPHQSTASPLRLTILPHHYRHPYHYCCCYPCCYCCCCCFISTTSFIAPPSFVVFARIRVLCAAKLEYRTSPTSCRVGCSQSTLLC